MIYTREFVAKEADRVLEMLKDMAKEWNTVLVETEANRHGLVNSGPYMSKVIHAMENVTSQIRNIQ